MKETEITELESRIVRYRKLEKYRDQIRTALDAVTKGWEDGPCGQGPFTGNYRESRQVKLLSIEFTATKGGSVAVDYEIDNLNIEASELGRFLEIALRSKLEAINAELEKI